MIYRKLVPLKKGGGQIVVLGIFFIADCRLENWQMLHVAVIVDLAK